MPRSARGDRVDDVEVEQLDPVARQTVPQRLCQPAIFVVAQSAACAVGIDHDRDRGVRTGSRGDLGDVTDGVEQLGRKVHAHNATHLTAVDSHQNEGFLGHEAQNGGQRRDQRARPVELEIGLRCRHATTVASRADRARAHRTAAVAPEDEPATGDSPLARNSAAHFEHRIGEQGVQRLGVGSGVGSVDDPLPRGGDLHISDPGDEGQSPSARCP